LIIVVIAIVILAYLLVQVSRHADIFHTSGGLQCMFRQLRLEQYKI